MHRSSHIARDFPVLNISPRFMQTPRFLTLSHTIRKLPAREGSTCDIAIIVTRGWH